MLRKILALVLFISSSFVCFSQSKLGDVACVYVTTPNLDSSTAFYEKLGFPKVASNSFPVAWSQSNDGSLMIMMRKDTAKYVGLTYYSSDVDKVADQLEKNGIQFTQKPKEGDPIKRYYFKSPDGLNIMLASNIGAFTQPTGISILNMGHEDIKAAEKYPNKLCGVFGEFSLPVVELNRSIEYWKKLGFEVKSQMNMTYPMAILSDGLMIIGLHQTKRFDYPAVTYFGIDTDKRIQELKKKGITGFKEIQGSGNVMIKTWEGLHFFIFSVGLSLFRLEI